MSRAQSSLRAPDEARVARVPDVSLVDMRLARAVRRGRGMWWFSHRTDDADDAGRFDLPRPYGTCYLADDAVAALIETFASPADLEPVVTLADVEDTVVYEGVLARPAAVADTTDRAARVPKELGTITPYTLTWQWADALHADGRGGLRAWLRHDPAGSRTIAVFGPASAPGQLPDTDVWSEPSAPEPASRWLLWLREAVTLVDVPTESDVPEAPDP